MRNRLDRALRILKLLQSGHRYDPCALAKQLQVGRRTMFRDIALLREMGIEVNYAPDRGQYVIGKLDQARRGVDESEFRDVLNRVISDENQDDSVTTIIRQVALALAGQVDGDESASHECFHGRDEGEPPGPAWADESESSVDAKSMPVDKDRLNCSERSGPIPIPTGWFITRENLSMLRRAVDDGSIIDVSETDPIEGCLIEPPTRVRPIEFTVSCMEVIVLGVNFNGEQIRSVSHSFRFFSEGVRDRAISRQSQARYS